MRSMLRSTLGVLVAVVALGAFASASASAALPEFRGSFPVAFTGTSNAVGFQEKAYGSYVCSRSSITGEIVGPKEVSNVVVKFIEGCAGFCKQSVHSGFWETKELKGRIGYLSKKEHTVGLLLEPVAEPIAKCERNTGNWKIQGSVIGRLGLVNVKRTSYKLEYGQTGGVQAVKSFEGEEATHTLQTLIEGGNPLETGMEVHEGMSLTMAKEVEIAA
jgi:hypothetical protein